MKYTKLGNMIIESGYKVFDQQSNCITRGNAICNTQYSLFIRSHEDTENYGFYFKRGELLESDLAHFKPYTPNYILQKIREYNKKDRSYFYMFFINRGGRMKPWGFLLLNYESDKIIFQQAVGTHLWKKEKALNYLKDLLITKSYLKEVN
jgi:hypothetical protein